MIEEYITSLSIPASFVLPGFFMTNLPNGIRLDPSGSHYAFAQLFHPDTKIPMLDVPCDFGKFVAACLADPSGTSGKRVLATSAWNSPLDVCQAVEKVTGKKCQYREMKAGEWKMGIELYENMVMINDWAYYGPDAKEGVKRSQEIVESVGEFGKFGTFEGFLKGIGFGK